MAEKEFEMYAMPEAPKTVIISGLESSVEIAAFSEALANFQMEVMQPRKDADNPFFGSKYVPMGNIVRSIMSVGPKHGLSYVQWAVQNEKGQIGICTRINHKTGQFMVFPPVFQTPAKGTVQDAGSVQSYQRRYSLQAAFGLGAEEDDDGNAASGIQEGETPAQKVYRENQEKKNQQQKPAYERGSYKNDKKNEQNASKSSKNGTNKPSDKPDNTTGAKPAEAATELQITKIKSICEVIANTQNIHPDDVYLKFQTLYKEQAKSNIPDMDKLTKGWAGGVINGLSKHNEAGQMNKIIPKDEPKKEDKKDDAKANKEREETANFDAEAHGDR